MKLGDSRDWEPWRGNMTRSTDSKPTTMLSRFEQGLYSKAKYACIFAARRRACPTPKRKLPALSDLPVDFHVIQCLLHFRSIHVSLRFWCISARFSRVYQLSQWEYFYLKSAVGLLCRKQGAITVPCGFHPIVRSSNNRALTLSATGFKFYHPDGPECSSSW